MGIARALKLKSLTTNHIKSSDQVHLAQHISVRRTTTGTMRKHNNHNNAPNVASMTAIVLLATSFKCVTATYTYIAGYEPASTVTSHAKLDLDVKDIIDILKIAVDGDVIGQTKSNANNGGMFKDCTSNACKWDGTDMYPTLWDTDCIHPYVSGQTPVPNTANQCKTIYGIYNQGKNSLKTDRVRSIGNNCLAGQVTPSGTNCGNGFASGLGAKTSGPATAKVASGDNQFIGAMNKYWKAKGLSEDTWAMDILEAAFKGEKVKDASDTKNKFDFAVVGRDFRKEVIQKGMIYFNIFPYVIWEMQDAINDCKDGDLTTNSWVGGMAVHAWDEAVAFYTGSSEAVTKGGVTGYSGGYLQYYLADKRCENFGTCTASYDTNPDDSTGESKVNEEIITLFQRGEAEITAAVDSTSATKCDIPAKTMEEIATKMLVPFIQGTIRYLHKTSTLSGRSAKQAGELFAFASTILPFIHAVDPAAATMLYSHVWEMPADPASDLNTVATIKSAIEATYPKLGFGAGIGTIKCSDIGQLYPYLSGCVDTISSTIADYAGYEPITDVSMHSRIDLDLEAITTATNIGGTCGSGCKLSDCSVATTVMADGTGCNYDGTTLAWPTTADGSFDIWTNGEHSKKATSIRKIRGFASGAKDKESENSPATNDVAYKANKFIAIMNKYWLSKSLDEHAG